MAKAPTIVSTILGFGGLPVEEAVDELLMAAEYKPLVLPGWLAWSS